MPPGPNGTATLHAVADTTDDDALNLGICSLRRRPSRSSATASKERLEAFMYRTAPVSVYALIAQAHDEYVALARDETVASVHRDMAVCRYYGAIAKALVPGLSHDETDRLGGDFPRLERMLKSLGYPPPAAPVAEGEVQAVESTTDAESVSSEPSTAATTPTG
jgi:hypothetical protein